MKTDASIRNIIVAAIRRHLRDEAECIFTRIFETKMFDELQLNISKIAHELPVAGTFLSPKKITLVTTRRILTLDNGNWLQMEAKDIKEFFPNDFKGGGKQAVTTGHVVGDDDSRVPVFIETKGPSMIVIYAIQTLRRIAKLRPKS